MSLPVPAVPASPGPTPQASFSEANSDDLPRKCRVAFRAVVVLLSFLQAWAARFEMTVDGVSYLDIGDAYFRGDWKGAVNAYWSPFYSWLAVLPRHILHIPISWESRFVHFENFCIALLTLASFEHFLTGLLRWPPATEPASGCVPLPRWGLRAIGYALYLYAAISWLTPALVGPDLLVEALVFLTAGVILRIRAGASTLSFLEFFLAPVI